MKDGHVKDGHVKDVAQDLVFEARSARALLATPTPPPPRSLRSSRLAEMGAQLGSSVPRKALQC